MDFWNISRQFYNILGRLNFFRYFQVVREKIAPKVSFNKNSAE